MTQDEQYLDLLSVFHYVLAGLTALFSCMTLFHVGIGIAMLCGAFETEDAPPRLFALMFILFPSVFLVLGWTLAGFMIAAGRKLKRRTSHMFCMAVAACECVLMPLGTVLGIFTIIVLTKEPVKELFSATEESK